MYKKRYTKNEKLSLSKDKDEILKIFIQSLNDKRLCVQNEELMKAWLHDKIVRTLRFKKNMSITKYTIAENWVETYNSQFNTEARYDNSY